MRYYLGIITHYNFPELSRFWSVRAQRSTKQELHGRAQVFMRTVPHFKAVSVLVTSVLCLPAVAETIDDLYLFCDGNTPAPLLVFIGQSALDKIEGAFTNEGQGSFSWSVTEYSQQNNFTKDDIDEFLEKSKGNLQHAEITPNEYIMSVGIVNKKYRLDRYSGKLTYYQEGEGNLLQQRKPDILLGVWDCNKISREDMKRYLESLNQFTEQNKKERKF